jgi:hypothetical protein
MLARAATTAAGIGGLTLANLLKTKNKKHGRGPGGGR